MENEKNSKQHKAAQPEPAAKKDDAGYTPQEDQFADGKGTQLSEQIEQDPQKDKKESKKEA